MPSKSFAKKQRKPRVVRADPETGLAFIGVQVTNKEREAFHKKARSLGQSAASRIRLWILKDIAKLNAN